MEQLRFSIPEILSLIGAAQCIYILVYMAFRSGRISRAGLPLAYFFVLALAFLSDFAQGYIGAFSYYDYAPWLAWFLGPPLSVLLVVQVAQINTVPALKYYSVLLTVPAAFLLAHLLTGDESACRAFLPCEDRRALLTVAGIGAGAVSLLTIWFSRNLFESLHAQKMGKDRYWLILAIVFVNIFLLVLMLASLNEHVEGEAVLIIRNILGLGFVYLVSTSLFRIYPQAVTISEAKAGPLNPQEKEIAAKIESLLSQEQVYQEPTYSRADLARECGISEASLSRIINLHFGKSFPQIMSEHRIADAKKLLSETEASVKAIAEDVGFNSMPSFNRVFKDMTGQTPSDYRRISRER